MNIQKAIDILELKIPFTLKELKKAYYKSALKHHPDKKKKIIFLPIFNFMKFWMHINF